MNHRRTPLQRGCAPSSRRAGLTTILTYAFLIPVWAGVLALAVGLLSEERRLAHQLSAAVGPTTLLRLEHSTRQLRLDALTASTANARGDTLVLAGHQWTSSSQGVLRDGRLLLPGGRLHADAQRVTLTVGDLQPRTVRLELAP